MYFFCGTCIFALMCCVAVTVHVNWGRRHLIRGKYFSREYIINTQVFVIIFTIIIVHEDYNIKITV